MALTSIRRALVMIRQYFQAWLKLIRVPNLLTVPGDPVAGFLLAEGFRHSRLSAIIASAIFFYAGGLIANDLADIEKDRIERPQRPLASGKIEIRKAWIATLVLWLTALLLCATISKSAALIALMLLSSIILYDFKTNPLPLTGALNMGFCRALSLLLGAAAADGLTSPVVWIAAFLIFAYISAVTFLAVFEMAQKVKISSLYIWLPTFSLVIGFGLLPNVLVTAESALEISICAVAAAIAAVLLSGVRALKIRRQDGVLPADIGHLISLLIVVQIALICVNKSGTAKITALILLFFLPLNYWLKKYFYAS